jgi:hypothetical protein
VSITRGAPAGVAVVAVAAFAAATFAAVPGSAAIAVGQVPVVSANVGGWHGTVKPRTIYVGQGGSPFVDRLHWTRWNDSSGRASGELWMIKNPACAPLYKCPYTHRPVVVTLSRVLRHGRALFYTRMKWAYHKCGKARVQRWHFTSRGFWQP